MSPEVLALLPQNAFTYEARHSLGVERDVVTRPSPPDQVVIDSLVPEGTRAVLDSKWAIFNAATLFGKYYVSRAVYRPSIKEGIPDLDVLVVARKKENGEYERLADLKLPVGVGEGEVLNWEDVRVLDVSKQGEQKALLGLTAVRVEQNKFVAHPALVEVSLVNGELVVGTTVVFDEVGKNVVPLKVNELIYRPDSESHSFHLLVRPTVEHKLAVITEIDFSDYKKVDWMSMKVGTVARAIPVDENIDLLPIHGVRSGVGIDGKPKEFIYSVGFAIIDKSWNILAVSKRPFWQRGDFLEELPMGDGLVRDEKKEVVYLDDWSKRDGTFEFLPNVGDRITVIKDGYSLSQLLDQEWLRYSDTTGSYQEFTLSPLVQEPSALAA